MVSITDSAAGKFKEIVKKQGTDGDGETDKYGKRAPEHGIA